MALTSLCCQTGSQSKGLSKSGMARLDSLFSDKKDSLELHFDSLCAKRYDEIFKSAVDSIRAVRTAEIKK